MYMWQESSHHLETEQLQQKVSVQMLLRITETLCQPWRWPSHLSAIASTQDGPGICISTSTHGASGAEVWNHTLRMTVLRVLQAQSPDHVHPYSLLWPRRPSQPFNCEQLPLGAEAPGQWTDNRKRSRLTRDTRRYISHPQLWRMDRATEHPTKLSQLTQVPTGFTCTCGHSLKQRKGMSHGFLRLCGSYTGVPKSPCSSGLLPGDWLLYSHPGPSQGLGCTHSSVPLGKNSLNQSMLFTCSPVAPFRLR